MSVAAADVLRPAPWSKSLTRWWRGADLPAVASLVASEAGLRGQLLPYTRVDGRPAFPLAVIDDDLAAQRLLRDQWPILDRGVLKEHASTGFAEAPPEAVALAGFVVVEPFRGAAAPGGVANLGADGGRGADLATVGCAVRGRVRLLRLSRRRHRRGRRLAVGGRGSASS